MLGCKKIVTGKNVYYIKTEWICFIMSVFHRKIIQVRSCSNVLWVTIYISSAKNFCQSVQKQRREAKWEEKNGKNCKAFAKRKRKNLKVRSRKNWKGGKWNILALYGWSWVGIWEFSWNNMGYWDPLWWGLHPLCLP